jgi:rare lipoprotein A
MQKPVLITLIFLLLVSACSQKQQSKVPKNTGRYAIKHDIAPLSPDFNVGNVEQWNIQPEAKSRYGNHSPYVVFGKTYYLVDSKQDFEQTGTASWYGKKFHGHKTSNMEIFDMYKMTAAHRTLPLPSYVEVTNLDNNKKVIVRVNDRGPFKSKRIIDLSWAAAKTLGYDTKGLARVHIRLIQAPGKNKAVQLSHHQLAKEDNMKITGMKFLQVGAFAEKQKALKIASQLSRLVLLPVHVTNTLASTPLYRVRIGPLSENENIIDILQKVHSKGFANTKMVVE